MTIASSAAAPPAALRVRVVAPGDDYHRGGAQCARCHRTVIPCDIIATSQHSPTITHAACLAARNARLVDDMRTEALLTPQGACWYHDSRTLSPCPLRADTHNLCTAHHEQLCCAPRAKKPTPRRRT